MITDPAAIVVLLVGFFTLYGWVLVAGRVSRGLPILEFETRQRVPWHWPELLLSFFLLFFGPPLINELLTPAANGAARNATAISYWAIIVSTFIALGLIAMLIKFRRSATWADLGWRLTAVGYDLALGIAAFLLVGPIVFLLQFIFVTLFQWKSEHPLIETLQEDATGGLFAAVAILAVVVAPLSEEFFFRVLLQGWLERLFFGRVSGEQTIDANALASNDEPILATLAQGPPSDWHAAYASPQPDPLIVGESANAPPVAAKFLPPILFSSLIFALLHYNHGPDPIPLFVLALALGYLYQRTHRLLPSATLHFCLNATTMLLVWLELQGPGE